MRAEPLSLDALRALARPMTVGEVAAQLGVSVDTVYDGVRSGRFPLIPIRLGRLVRFRPRDVVRLIEGDDAR